MGANGGLKVLRDGAAVWGLDLDVEVEGLSMQPTEVVDAKEQHRVGFDRPGLTVAGHHALGVHGGDLFVDDVAGGDEVNHLARALTDQSKREIEVGPALKPHHHSELRVAGIEGLEAAIAGADLDVELTVAIAGVAADHDPGGHE